MFLISREEKYQCGFLFADCDIEEIWIGVCMLVIALVMLVGCLGVLVKVLNSLMKEYEKVVRLNAEMVRCGLQSVNVLAYLSQLKGDQFKFIF